MEALKNLARNVPKKPILAVSPDIKTVTSVESVNLLDLVNNKSIEEQEKQSLLRQSAEMQISHPILPPMPPTSMLVTAGASGGSSPSREVQEILSLKDSECMNDFYNDSEENQDETDGSGNNADVPDTLDDDDNDDDDNDADDDAEKNSNLDSEDADEIEDAKDDHTYTLNEVNGKLEFRQHKVWLC